MVDWGGKKTSQMVEPEDINLEIIDSGYDGDPDNQDFGGGSWFYTISMESLQRLLLLFPVDLVTRHFWLDQVKFEVDSCDSPNIVLRCMKLWPLTLQKHVLPPQTHSFCVWICSGQFDSHTMRYQLKVEYSCEKFIKFYKDFNYIDGEIKDYTFRELVGDIKRNCASLQHLSAMTMRIRYKDEDGHFINFNEDDEDNFCDVFQSASVAGDSLYEKSIGDGVTYARSEREKTKDG